MPKLRIVTYNVHRCRGIDNRERPARIVDVLREIDADVVALQEVVSIGGKSREKDQARYVAEELGFNYVVGENRKLNGGAYGNVVLSKFPMRLVCNHDISVRARERRGCLHTDVDVAGAETLHVFNVHLGTAYLERRHQGRRLVEEEILNNRELKGSRIMLGDFNEWTRGLTTRLLRAHLKSVDVRSYLQAARTFPGDPAHPAPGPHLLRGPAGPEGPDRAPQPQGPGGLGPPAAGRGLRAAGRAAPASQSLTTTPRAPTALSQDSSESWAPPLFRVKVDSKSGGGTRSAVVGRSLLANLGRRHLAHVRLSC
jgi:endonuclease/exonuclease/phosphatase family metal-dependent hydrolase